MITLLIWACIGLAGVFLAAALITVGVLRYYDRRDDRARQQLRAKQGGDHA